MVTLAFLQLQKCVRRKVAEGEFLFVRQWVLFGEDDVVFQALVRLVAEILVVLYFHLQCDAQIQLSV